MRYRYFIAAFLISLLICFLGGCGNEIPELTEEETKMVEEYAAQLVLKYDRNYQATLLNEEKKQEKLEKLQRQMEIQKQIQDAKSNADSGQENNSEAVDAEAVKEEPEELSSLLETGAIDIRYADCLNVEVYPENTQENDWQGVTVATNGNKLLVFRFSLTNESQEALNPELTGKDARFAFEINDTLRKTPLTTLLVDDFHNFDETLEPGESKTVVFLVEVSAETADNLQTVRMIVKYKEKRAEYTLQ